MNVNSVYVDFNTVSQKVMAITDTENLYIVDGYSDRVADINNYSEYGLTTLGRMTGFPANFVRELNKSNAVLAGDIVKDRLTNYFAINKNAHFYAREFSGKIQGCVSDKYSFFDDDSVCEIISNSPLSQLQYQPCDIVPERLHLRAIALDSPFTQTEMKVICSQCSL